MKCLIVCLILLSSLVGKSVFGADADVESKRAAYQRDLDRIKKDPKEYESAKLTFTFMTKLTLAALGYGTCPIDGTLDEATTSALLAYQKKRNIPQTGDPMSFETFEQLEADRKIIDFHPLRLPGLVVVTDLWDDGYVSGSGTWVLSIEKTAYPEQTSRINCNEWRRICTEATAIVTGEGDDRFLSIDIETYEIERWDDHELVTKPRAPGFGCARYVRRINRNQKTVTGIRSTISNEGICKGVENRELYMTLSDGFKTYRDLLKARNEKWVQSLNVSLDSFKDGKLK
jgi:hypothetical protein